MLIFQCSDEAKKILEVLEHLGYKPNLNELQVVKDVCDMISMRSARLAAAGLATIIRVSWAFFICLEPRVVKVLKVSTKMWTKILQRFLTKKSTFMKTS